MSKRNQALLEKINQVVPTLNIAGASVIKYTPKQWVERTGKVESQYDIAINIASTFNPTCIFKTLFENKQSSLFLSRLPYHNTEFGTYDFECFVSSDKLHELHLLFNKAKLLDPKKTWNFQIKTLGIAAESTFLE